MTKTTTNVLGIIIVILAGIYFYVSYCSSCARSNKTAAALNSNNANLADITKTNNKTVSSRTVVTDLQF